MPHAEAPELLLEPRRGPEVAGRPPAAEARRLELGGEELEEREARAPGAEAHAVVKDVEGGEARALALRGDRGNGGDGARRRRTRDFRRPARR